MDAELSEMRISSLFNEFFHSEKSSGIVLIICSTVAILLSNGTTSYLSLWQTPIANHSLLHWINDGLMTVFFLLIGLEIEREMYAGEFAQIKNAILPVAAAIGGMVVPALIHFSLNAGTATQAGAGIPMATDIAFALGILSLAGRNAPPALRVFLTALAIIDDLGAILVIAIFYTGTIAWFYLGAAGAVFAMLLIFNRTGVNNLWMYLIPGAFMWYFMLHSGIHATITGVLLAFAIPFRDGSITSPSYGLQQFLHKPVAFFILPLFALANAGVLIGPELWAGLLSQNGLGIILGLCLGKPLGIAAASWVVLKLKWSSTPAHVNWRHLIGAGCLGGIGFTMSIFVTLLAFTDPHVIEISKGAILLSSILSGLLGFAVLTFRAREADQA
ncbi:MAG: Na+/H+ antiporter NhaA [Leptospirales bacterium]|nr:Na+/H+ antiporter NhaA [Leptospirales bacterium]